MHAAHQPSSSLLRGARGQNCLLCRPGSVDNRSSRRDEPHAPEAPAAVQDSCGEKHHCFCSEFPVDCRHAYSVWILSG